MDPPLISEASRITIPEGALEPIAIEAPIKEGRRVDLLDWIVCSATTAVVLLVLRTAVVNRLFHPLFFTLLHAGTWEAVVQPGLLWGLTGTLFLVFRTILWFSYRPFPSSDYRNAPSLTVIIPAYNEGEMVKKAIYSVLEADYPRGRLEVFVIDDGSTDDTWQYIREAARAYPHMITPVRFPKNRGKRAGLEEGFRRARGNIVMTLDSDSVVERASLLAMAGPFANPKVGAVAGKVLVYNRTQGLIPRMLQVRYVLSFDFLRAIQSTYGTVYCCPGALSAYRRAVVRRVLPQWINQTFLGRRCTYGEDRAMTNFILSAGYDAVFQRTGRVHTVVPWKYRKLCKMYLRWDRSYVREFIHFMRIVWKRSPRSMFISLADMIITNMRFPVGWASLVFLAVLSVHHPATLLRFFSAMAILSTMNMFYYWYTERSWLFPYGIIYAYFSFLTLLWVFPYALFTLRVRAWGTR